MHYLRLLQTYYRLSILNELQYRANLVMQTFSSLVQLGIGLAGIGLVFYNADSLGGWQPAELLVVLGVYTLIAGISRSLIMPNMYELMEGIYDGKLDYTLTKPEDSQLLISITRFQPWRLVDVIVGLVVIGLAISRLAGTIGAGQALVFAILLLCGAIIIYCFWVAITTLTFWVIRMWEVFEMFEAAYQAGRWPVGIYPTWLQLGLTFIVPVAFAVTVPAQALTARLSLPILLMALFVTALALGASRWFWFRGLKSYAGATA
ncbi:MAG: ABC-2 family transporter protein [Anaerolineae bacterium]|nr:MAG: ABC-2 family transporter protein [Anaerolineae bacterium]